VAATVQSESEFQSWAILWLNTFLRISSLQWRMSNLSLFSLVHLLSALRKNISGSSRSNPFIILNTWIISPQRRLKCSDGNLRACSLSSYDRCLRWGINLVTRFVSYRSDIWGAIWYSHTPGGIWQESWIVAVECLRQYKRRSFWWASVVYWPCLQRMIHDPRIGEHHQQTLLDPFYWSWLQLDTPHLITSLLVTMT